MLSTSSTMLDLVTHSQMPADINGAVGIGTTVFTLVSMLNLILLVQVLLDTLRLGTGSNAVAGQRRYPL